MNLSFYSAAVGAMTQQQRLNTIANNFANANNDGYKTMTGTFASLLYKNVRLPGPELEEARVGVGAKMQRTNINFNAGALSPTDYPLDFTITGEGFFAVRDPATADIYYTRSGAFQMSMQQNGQFYLATANGDWVLDSDMNPITLAAADDEVAPGVFTFDHYEGFEALGNNYYVPAEKNGQPTAVVDPQIRRGVLEASNVEVAKEFTEMITAQRLYSFSLQMVQTSDDIAITVNNLRN